MPPFCCLKPSVTCELLSIFHILNFPLTITLPATMHNLNFYNLKLTIMPYAITYHTNWQPVFTQHKINDWCIAGQIEVYVDKYLVAKPHVININFKKIFTKLIRWRLTFVCVFFKTLWKKSILNFENSLSANNVSRNSR